MKALAILFALFSFQNAFAIPTPRVHALVQEIQLWEKQKKTDFSSLIKKWEKQYGSQAALPLFELGQIKKHSEHERTLALLSSLKLSNASQKKILKTKIESLYQEKTWIIRSAALRMDAELNPEQAIRKAEKLVIEDPALVVRLQAAKLLGTLANPKPEQTSQILLKAIRDSKNYRPEGLQNGRSDGVSEVAFASLRKLKSKKIKADLKEISKEARDPRVRAHALYTLKAI